jgi:hypothetical protein
LSSSDRDLVAGVHVDPGDAEAIAELMRLVDEARESALAAGAIDDGDYLFTEVSRRLATPQRRLPHDVFDGDRHSRWDYEATSRNYERTRG